MNRDDQPPYTENEQIILNCARELIYAMRLLRNAVSSGDERTIVAKIAYMRMQLRWLRSIDRALSKEPKNIEGKHPVRPGDVE